MSKDSGTTMGISAVLIFAAGVLLLLCLQCASSKSHAPVQKLGRSEIVRFGSWVKEGRTLVTAGLGRYEVRRSSDRGKDELLFAVKTETVEESRMKRWYESVAEGDLTVFSKSYYAVDVAGLQSHTATEQEWRQAKPILHSRDLIPAGNLKPPGVDIKTEGIVYRGKLYAKSGASWGDTLAIISPGGKWLAVFSYTLKELPPPYIDRNMAPEEGAGDLFWDVYAVSTGEKVIAHYVPFRQPPSMRFSKALWLEDSFLVMPLELSLETCLVGIMPVN